MADQADGETRAILLATGQRAAETLARSMADKPADAPIETNAGSLRGLAEVIGALVGEANRCGGVDCMGRSIDGMKLWVTRDRFEEIESRAARYEATLRAIARAAEAGGDMDMLIDWQGTARAMSTSAQQALDG